MFVKINNGVAEKFPYSFSEMRKANPNVSFPQTYPDEAINAVGVYRVTEAAAPEINTLTQKRERNAMPELSDGQWFWGWTVSDKSQDEIAAETAKEAVKIRKTRYEKLTETDWTQLTDAPVNSALWATYRQALRDVPTQEGFPWEVTWPTQPE